MLIAVLHRLELLLLTESFFFIRISTLFLYLIFRMRHYEIIFLVNASNSDQVQDMLERYQSLIKENEGQVHRLEDWGVRQLAYPIKKSDKAHYILMNIECSQKTLTEIKESFQFNDSIIRNMILRRDEAITTLSPIMQESADEESKVA